MSLNKRFLNQPIVPERQLLVQFDYIFLMKDQIGHHNNLINHTVLHFLIAEQNKKVYKKMDKNHFVFGLNLLF